MAVRIISSIVGVFIFVALFLGGTLTLKIGAAVTSLIGMYELYTAVSKQLKPVHFVGFAAEIWYVFLMEKCDPLLNRFMIFTAVIALLVLLVAQHETTSIHDVSITVFGFFYAGMLLYCLVELYLIKPAFIWLPPICAWGSDTFAYFVGVKFGKHKLAPVLSPKKSIEGSIGGVIGSGVLMTLFFFVCVKIGYITDARAIPIYTLMGMAAAAFSQVGDIAASAIKRQMGIKDYGKIMPGHGGVMDRFDSVLITAPVIYMAITILHN